MQAGIDANDVKTWLLYNDTTGKVEPARTDPVTGAILIYGVTPDANTPATIDHALIDANDVKTKLAYNNIQDIVEPMRCGVGGELLITVPLA